MQKKKRILLVEDEQLIARAYQLGLEESGFDVDVVLNGEQALEAMSGVCSYDVILLDIILPRVDGFEVLEKRRKQGLCPHAVVIILSNLGQDSDIARAKELGAVEFLIKAEHSLQDIVLTVKRAVGYAP